MFMNRDLFVLCKLVSAWHTACSTSRMSSGKCMYKLTLIVSAGRLNWACAFVTVFISLFCTDIYIKGIPAFAGLLRMQTIQHQKWWEAKALILNAMNLFICSVKFQTHTAQSSFHLLQQWRSLVFQQWLKRSRGSDLFISRFPPESVSELVPLFSIHVGLPVSPAPPADVHLSRWPILSAV